MPRISPVGWSDLVTKRDVDALRVELSAEMRAGQSEMLLRFWFVLIASQATLVGLVLAAVRLG